MKEQLERVIRKIILPQYPKIEDVDIDRILWNRRSEGNDYDYDYHLTYIVRDDAYSYSERRSIGKETYSLWDLLSPNDGDNLNIQFKNFETWKNS
jgi:hypothetical protein